MATYKTKLYSSVFGVCIGLVSRHDPLAKTVQTPNTDEYSLGDRAPGANVRTQEGNNPDRQLFPSLFSLSPLSTAHPLVLQH